MSTIPLFIHEEHHEAFLIWHHAIQNRLLAAEGNGLLHVDNHADMGRPFLRTPIHQFPQALAEISRFTYDELGIGTFIIPAVYQQIFNTIYWLKPKPGKAGTENTYVRTHKQAGTYFIVGPDFSPWPHNKPWQDRVCFAQHIISMENKVPQGQPLVLDIDLDFFSCEFFVDAATRVEVTQQEFERFTHNKYHPLRLHSNGYAEQTDSRYYLVFNANLGEKIDTAAKLSQDAILKRIEAFGEFLSVNNIEPVLIDICRSRMSGYTPGEQWEYIETHLLDRLRELYAFEPVFIDEIC